MGGSSSTSKLQDKHVVVIGGGYAGITVAIKLSGKCKVTLIDPKEAFHHCIGALRACTEDGYARKTFVEYEPTFGTNFKRGTVESIDANSKKVTLTGGEGIVYDFLIIATGSQGKFPCNVSGGEDCSVYIAQYNQFLQKIKTSKDIVVVGGGAVGLEMAGEIATDFHDKNITLIHSSNNIVNDDVLPKFRKGISDQLTKKGVKLILGERVSNLNDIPRDGSSRCTVKTNKETEVAADYVIVCIGLPCNSSAYATSLASCTEQGGYLKVNQFFAVEGLTDVYAIGDCCNITRMKLGYHAEKQGDLIAKNLLLKADGKACKPWKEPGQMMIVPVGRNGGSFQIGSTVLGPFFAKKLKSEGLFTSRYWDLMKQKMPKN